MTQDKLPPLPEPTPMVHQCCGRAICDGKECPNGGPWYKVPDWRMDGYYYSFEPTGLAAIDRILSAVGCAGKAFHHTEDWNEEADPRDHLRGDTPIKWIQNAAIDAAAILSALAAARAEADSLRADAERWRFLRANRAEGIRRAYEVINGEPPSEVVMAGWLTEDIDAALDAAIAAKGKQS